MAENRLDESLRDQILEDLSEHFSRDTLGVEEYEQRVQAVLKAVDNLELIKVNQDILPPTRYNHSPVPGGFPQEPAAGSPGHVQQQAVAIFSGSNLSGSFDAPDKLDAVAIFGGCKVDLRDARMPLTGMVIEVAAIFGGVDIILPQNCDFQVQVTAIFGGVDNPPLKRPSGRPMITIRGAAVFGGLEIKQP